MVSLTSAVVGLVAAAVGVNAYESQWGQLRGMGTMMQVSYDGKTLCGVNTANNIFCATDNIDYSPNWRMLPGSLKWVAVWGDNIWGVNGNNDIFTAKIQNNQPTWVQLPGKLKQITADGKQICGVNANNDIYCADSNILVNPNWRQLQGKLKQVDLTDGILYGVAPDNSIWWGMSNGEPSFTKVNGALNQISYDGELLCGLSGGSNTDIYCADTGLKSNPNWRKLDGAATNLDVQAGRIFAVGTDSNVYRKWMVQPPAVIPFTGWRVLQGVLVQVNTDGRSLCGVNGQDQIYCTTSGFEGQPEWRNIEGRLTQVVVWGDRLYGVNRDNNVYAGSAIGAPGWVQLPGQLKQIVTDGKQLCGVSPANDVWCADSNIDTNPNWRLVEGKYKSISILNGVMFGVSDKNEIYMLRIKGDANTIKLDGNLRNLEFDGASLCGTNLANDIWCADAGFTTGKPNWRMVDGKLKQLTISGNRMFGIGENNADIYSRMDL